MTAFAALSLVAAPEASAQAPVATRLFWDGSVCGSAEDFAERVGKRTSVVRFVRRGQRLVVRARIERRGDGLEASALIEARGRAPIVRRIESPGCDDALDALALVVAIGIEGRSSPTRGAPRAGRRRTAPELPPPPSAAAPEASTNEVHAEPELPSAAAETPPSGAAPPALPGELQPAASDTSAPNAAARTPAPVTPRRPAPAAPRQPSLDVNVASARAALEIEAGLAASTSIGVAPHPLWGGSFWISAGWARAGVWSPQLVAGADYQRLDGVNRPNGVADFALSAGTLSLCPLRLGSEAIALRPCTAAALGWLAADGHDTFDGRSETRPWWALGGTLQAIARAGSVELRAVLGATAPLTRDSFAFGRRCIDTSACEADVFHQVAPLIWSGSVGAGIRVW